MSGNPEARLGSGHTQQDVSEETPFVASSPPLSKMRLSRMLRECRETSGMTADQVNERALEIAQVDGSIGEQQKLRQRELPLPEDTEGRDHRLPLEALQCQGVGGEFRR